MTLINLYNNVNVYNNVYLMLYLMSYELKMCYLMLKKKRFVFNFIFNVGLTFNVMLTL